MGAACITAVLNVTRELDLPYAFGGDGATVLIPPGCAAWSRMRSAAPGASPARLRARAAGRPGAGAGAEAAGRGVLVAKYQLSPGNNLAMFAGGGLELADG